MGLNALEKHQLSTLGYVTGILPLILLSLLVLEFLLLPGLVIFRRDHRGIHEISSKIQNAPIYDYGQLS